jgi:hypothetical protein
MERIMRRFWIGLFGLPLVMAVYACAGSKPVSEPVSGTASDDNCPLLDAGPPPVCPEGCDWNDNACRKHSGIIVEELVDGGSDAKAQ